MKMLDDVMVWVRRYAPILIMHLLMLLYLSTLVLDLSSVPPSGSIWANISRNIDSTLKVVGLPIDRWYVLAALLLTYVTLFEWLRNLVLSLRGFRLSFVTRWNPNLLGRACRVLRLPPDQWEVEKALRFQIDRSSERVQQTNQRHPYQSLIDRQASLSAYYGMLIIALAAMLGWFIAGSPMARSPERVLGTAFLLGVGALCLRWAIRSLFMQREYQTGHWALNEYERDNDLSKVDPLAREREREMRKLAAEEAAFRKHPAPIIGRLLFRLGGKFSDRVRKRIVYPRFNWQRDWPSLASAASLFTDEVIQPPAALSVTDFAARFAPLLERSGTGLFVIVPARSRLAVGATCGGSLYSFDLRRHEIGDLTLKLTARDKLLEQSSPARLSVIGKINNGFIVKVGLFAIEDLLLGYFPANESEKWSRIIDVSGLDATAVGALDEDAPDRASTQREAELELGASYIVGGTLESGSQVRIGLQCFGVKGSERLLVAWGFFHVQPLAENSSIFHPWWHLSAWKGLLSPQSD